MKVNPMNHPVVKILSDHPLPEYATAGSAAIDIRITSYHILPVDEQSSVGVRVLCKTGIRMAIEPGWAGLVLPRSGLGSRGLWLAHTVGLIDSDYRGDFLLPLIWMGRGLLSDVLNVGDRIAQMVFIPAPQAEIVRALTVSDLGQTARDQGGFGSTGV